MWTDHVQDEAALASGLEELHASTGLASRVPMRYAISLIEPSLFMNTPRKRKRYTAPPEPMVEEGAIYVGVIEGDEYHKHFSRIISGFTYLEDRMTSVLAVLLGDSDHVAAGCVMRAIKSPKGRVDVMLDLLQLAPINAHLGDEYDQIIDEFRIISNQRNSYAHGRWWTKVDGEVMLDEGGDPREALRVIRIVTIDELTAFSKRILKLHGAIRDWPERELERRRTEREQRP